MPALIVMNRVTVLLVSGWRIARSAAFAEYLDSIDQVFVQDAHLRHRLPAGLEDEIVDTPDVRLERHQARRVRCARAAADSVQLAPNGRELAPNGRELVANGRELVAHGRKFSSRFIAKLRDLRTEGVHSARKFFEGCHASLEAI
jgi:hypothetical protein